MLALLNTIIDDGEELIRDIDGSLARIEQLQQRRSVAAQLENESRAEGTGAQNTAASPVDDDDGQATKQIVERPSSSLDLVQNAPETAHNVGEIEISDDFDFEDLATAQGALPVQSPTQTKPHVDPQPSDMQETLNSTVAR